MFYLSCYVSFFPSWCLGWDFKLNCVYSYAFCSYIALYDYGLDSFLCIVILVSDDTLSVAFWNGSRSSTSFSEITRKQKSSAKKKKKKNCWQKKKKLRKLVVSHE